MTRLATAFALAVGLACTASAVAQPAAPVARGAQQDVAPFVRVALLELPSGAGASRVDRLRGEVRVELAAELEDAWAAQHQRRVADLSLVADSVVAPDHIIVRLASLGTDLLRVRTPFGGLDYLVVGELRELPHIRRHFFGRACASTLPPIEDEALTAAVAAYCETRETAPLAAAESDRERPAGLRQVASALRYEGLSELNHPRLERFERLTESGVGDVPKLTAWTALAMQHAFRDELPAALDALLEARTLANGLEEPGDSIVLIDALGSALFERIVRGSLAVEAPLVAVYYAERFASWERDKIDADLALTLGRAYRWAGLPEHAARRFVEVVASGHAEEWLVLQELSWTYLEAGDTFRSVETLAYVREQYPDREPDPLLTELVADHDGETPLDPCGLVQEDRGSAALLIALACARRAGDLDAEAAVLDEVRARSASEEDAILTSEFADRLAAELAWRRQRAADG